MCVAVADGLLWGGNAHGGGGVQGTYGENAEQDLSQSGGGGGAFPWGAWPWDAAVTRTSKQAGKALRSQGHQYACVM